MQIEMSHLQTQGIHFAVFKADARTHSNHDRDVLLGRLTAKARARLRVDKSALVFTEGGRVRFYGASDLVRYLASHGVPSSTHRLDV